MMIRNSSRFDKKVQILRHADLIDIRKAETSSRIAAHVKRNIHAVSEEISRMPRPVSLFPYPFL